MTQVVLPDCPPPYYVLAHSTGGHIILRLIRTRNWFKKCVLVAPLIDLNYGAWPVSGNPHPDFACYDPAVGLGLSARQKANTLWTE